LNVNPTTGLLARVINEDSVKQSLRNLILTNPTERFYQPFLGSKVRSSLFEPMTPVTVDTIRFSIENTIKQEPRVQLVRLDVIPDYDNNQYNVGIYFEVLNFPGKTFAANILIDALR